MICPDCDAEIPSGVAACRACGYSFPFALWSDAQAADDAAFAPSAPVIGRKLEDRYVIEGYIARGGMGEVYRGTDTRMERTVAIKLLDPRLVSEPREVQRFLREATATARIDHPNVVEVYSVGELDGRPYLVMKFIEGKTLSDLLGEKHRFSLVEAVRICRQVCDTLAHVHAKGLVHRDIKPHNLMLDARGRCLMLDFGLLKLLDQSVTLSRGGAGTPAYMPPEQFIAPQLADARSDLYSLGATFFEMITGERHFATDDARARVLIPKATARFAGLPPVVDTFFLQALAVKPSERFSDAADMKAALEGVMLNTVATGSTSSASLKLGELPKASSSPALAAAKPGVNPWLFALAAAAGAGAVVVYMIVR